MVSFCGRAPRTAGSATGRQGMEDTKATSASMSWSVSSLVLGVMIELARVLGPSR